MLLSGVRKKKKNGVHVVCGEKEEREVMWCRVKRKNEKVLCCVCVEKCKERR